MRFELDSLGMAFASCVADGGWSCELWQKIVRQKEILFNTRGVPLESVVSAIYYRLKVRGAAGLSHNLATKENVITIGCQGNLNAETVMKMKATLDGRLSAFLEYQGRFPK